MSASTRLDTIASFLPTIVVDRLAAGPVEMPAPERFAAAALFADISGFTALTERLAQQGPAGVEELTRLLNAYFERLVDRIAEHGGVVVKFAGDALLALWRSTPEGLPGAVLRAAQAGLGVQTAMREFASEASSPLSLKVSIGAGDVVTAHLGGVRERREFFVAGDPLEQVGRANSSAKPGDVVVAAEAARAVAERLVGPRLDGGAVRVDSVRDAPSPTPLPGPRADERAVDALLAYLPAAIRTRLGAGGASWLAELRRLTILFVNLGALDRRASLVLAQTVMEALQTTVYRFEGSVNKLSVDDKGATLVIAFGLPPLAHEDDAARGAQAALAIEGRLRELGLECAIGVTTGRAFCGVVGGVRRREYTIMGDVVNLAARLMVAAKTTGAGVLCDEPTRSGAGARLEFEDLAPISVKGKADAVAIARPLAARAAGVRVGAGPGGTRASRRLIGRDRERAAVLEAIEAVAAASSSGAASPSGAAPSSGELAAAAATALPGAVAIEGEAGIGKSALLADAIERASTRGFAVFAGEGDAIEAATPYHAWRPVLRRALGLDVAAPEPDAQRAAALAALAPDPALLALAPLLADVLPLEIPPSERTAQLEGEARADNLRRLIAGAVRLAAADAPVLLAVEDAQWLDSASWAALGAVARGDGRALVLLALRPLGDGASADGARLVESRSTRRISLGPLTAAESAELVRRRLGATASLPVEVSDLIRDRTHGNPFFCTELADALREAGRVEVEHGECRVVGAGGALASVIPDTIEGLVTSRIDRLAPEEQLAVKAAAVIGRAFAVRTLREIYPLEAARARVEEHVEALARARFTAMIPAAGEPSHAFVEATTREVAYNLMSFAQRRELHRAIATELERAQAADLAPVYAVLAHHWRKAEDDPRALEFLGRAGEQALRIHAAEEAAAFFREAIVVGARIPDLAPDVLGRCEAGLGFALFALGDLEGSTASFRDALAHLGHAPPGGMASVLIATLRAVARQALHRFFPGRCIGRATGAARDRALEIARLEQTLSQIYYYSHRSIESVFFALDALNLAERAGPSAELAMSYAHNCLVASVVPWHSLARAYAARALEVARGARRPGAQAYVHELLGVYEAGTGGWRGARANLDEGARIATAAGDGRRAEECNSNHAVAAFYQGDFEGSARLFQAVHDSGRLRRDAQSQAWGLLGGARCLLVRGRTDEAIARVEEAEARLLRRRVRIDKVAEVEAHGLLARALLRRGDLARARAEADRVLEAYADVQPTAYYAEHTYAGAAEVHVSLLERALGKARGPAPSGRAPAPALDAAPLAAAARRTCRLLTRYARVFPIGRSAALRWRARLDLAEGRDRRGARGLAASLAEARRLQMPHEEALALADLAEVATDGGERARLLSEAKAIFEKLGATYDAERVTERLSEGKSAP